jgi:hypothetical protein
MSATIDLTDGNTLTTDVGGFDILELNESQSLLFSNQCCVTLPLTDEAHPFIVKDISVLIKGKYSDGEIGCTFQSYAVVSGKSADSFTVRLSGR